MTLGSPFPVSASVRREFIVTNVPPINEFDKNQSMYHPGLDLVRATEAAALAAGRWMGLGDRSGADHAAQDAMAEVLNQISIRGRIISGEERRVGEHSPLDSNAEVGNGTGPELDVEVNAIDGASLVAAGKTGAVSVAAFSPSGSMWSPGPAVYMQKLVVGRPVADQLGPEALDAPPAWTLAMVARASGKDIRDLVVFVLDRPRHQELIEDIRRAGARVFLRGAGDIGGALLAATKDSGVDVLMGVGGAAEGLITGCAVKALGGAMLGRINPLSESETAACENGGVDMTRIMTCEDLVKGNDVYFAATGITEGVMLDGVRYHGDTVDTQSVVLRLETGTTRIIKTEYRLR